MNGKPTEQQLVRTQCEYARRKITEALERRGGSQRYELYRAIDHLRDAIAVIDKAYQ